MADKFQEKTEFKMATGSRDRGSPQGQGCGQLFCFLNLVVAANFWHGILFCWLRLNTVYVTLWGFLYECDFVFMFIDIFYTTYRNRDLHRLLIQSLIIN